MPIDLDKVLGAELAGAVATWDADDVILTTETTRAELVGEALVLDWTVLARHLNGPLVEAHGVEISILDPGDFSLDQSCRAREGFGDPLHPLEKLPPVLLYLRKPLAALVRRVG